MLDEKTSLILISVYKPHGILGFSGRIFFYKYLTPTELAPAKVKEY